MKFTIIMHMCETLESADLRIRDVECHELLGKLSFVSELFLLDPDEDLMV